MGCEQAESFFLPLTSQCAKEQQLPRARQPRCEGPRSPRNWGAAEPRRLEEPSQPTGAHGDGALAHSRGGVHNCGGVTSRSRRTSLASFWCGGTGNELVFLYLYEWQASRLIGLLAKASGTRLALWLVF